MAEMGAEERKERPLTAPQTKLPFKISQQPPHRSSQKDKASAKISNNISNKQPPQANTFAARHGLATSRCQTAQGHLRVNACLCTGRGAEHKQNCSSPNCKPTKVKCYGKSVGSVEHHCTQSR